MTAETMSETLVLAVEQGALLQVPQGMYEEHRRGKNWLARIKVDPKAPGGLGRTFAPRAHGEFYYLISELKPGDPIEFGADYYTGAGRKQARRWYGVVAAISDAGLTVTAADTARKACALARTYQQERGA